MKSHRITAPLQQAHRRADHPPRPRSLLASRAVWIGGALSLAAWAAIAWLVI